MDGGGAYIVLGHLALGQCFGMGFGLRFYDMTTDAVMRF